MEKAKTAAIAQKVSLEADAVYRTALASAYRAAPGSERADRSCVAASQHRVMARVVTQRPVTGETNGDAFVAGRLSVAVAGRKGANAETSIPAVVRGNTVAIECAVRLAFKLVRVPATATPATRAEAASLRAFANSDAAANVQPGTAGTAREISVMESDPPRSTSDPPRGGPGAARCVFDAFSATITMPQFAPPAATDGCHFEPAADGTRHGAFAGVAQLTTTVEGAQVWFDAATGALRWSWPRGTTVFVAEAASGGDGPIEHSLTAIATLLLPWPDGNAAVAFAEHVNAAAAATAAGKPSPVPLPPACASLEFAAVVLQTPGGSSGGGGIAAAVSHDASLVGSPVEVVTGVSTNRWGGMDGLGPAGTSTTAAVAPSRSGSGGAAGVEAPGSLTEATRQWLLAPATAAQATGLLALSRMVPDPLEVERMATCVQEAVLPDWCGLAPLDAAALTAACKAAPRTDATPFGPLTLGRASVVPKLRVVVAGSTYAPGSFFRIWSSNIVT
jgi:hypothetical protein